MDANHHARKATKALAIITKGNFINTPQVDLFRIKYLNEQTQKAIHLRNQDLQLLKKVLENLKQHAFSPFPLNEIEALNMQEIHALSDPSLYSSPCLWQ